MRAGTKVGLCLAVLLLPLPLRAQGLLDRFSYDGLRLSGIGVDVGPAFTDRLAERVAVGLHVDYGVIAPNVRTLFSVSYLRSDFNADEIARFADRLRQLVHDPTNDFTIDVGTIQLTDVAFDLDLQYLFGAGHRITPYLGLGVGVHVRDAAGAAIQNTFVEDALQTLAGGVNGTAGVEVGMTRGVALTLDARAEVTGGLLLLTTRGGVMIRLPHGQSR